MVKEELPLFGFFFDIDLFGSDVDIYYKGRPKRNSWIGRIFTLCYVGIYIFFLIFRLIRMVNKEDVTFYDTYAFNGEPPFMKLNTENYRSGFAIIHPKTKQPFINQSIYIPKMTYTYGIKHGSSFNFTSTDVPLEVCDINKFHPNYRYLFRKKDLDNLYCAKHIDHLLQGHRAYDVYSYLNIQFYPCVNTSKNNNTCAPTETITAILNKFGINFAMQDVEITPEDYKSPTKPRLKDVTLSVSSKLFMEVYSYLRVINVETDEDIFGFGTSNNIRRGKYLKYDQSQMLYSPNELNLTNPNVSLISFTVSLSEQELTETRTYPKLVTVIGDVGGFMEVIFSVFRVLVSILTETLYQKSLVNHLFSFDLDRKLVLVKQKHIKHIKKSKNIEIYNPNKSQKNSLINNTYKIKENESNIKDIEQHNKHIKDVDSHKEKHLTNSKSNQKKIIFSKKTSGYSSIFDMKIKYPHLYKDNGDSQLEYSSRVLKNNKNTLKDKDIEINIMDLNKAEKESDISNNSNIITKIKLNQFKPKFCYKKKRERFEKILLEEGMKIILKKLDVQNLFKKIYKDNPEIDEKNADSEYIEMSDNCKKELRNVLDGEVRTLVI